jgi:hypothetical protein
VNGPYTNETTVVFYIGKPVFIRKIYIIKDWI